MRHTLKLLVIGFAGLVLAGGALAGDAPDEVELGVLSELYEPVVFDHAGHEDLADSCGQCHHHTVGTAPESEKCATCHDAGDPGPSVACVDCHVTDPFTAETIEAAANSPDWYHVDKPGLKGAFHRACLGCHEETGAPAGCTDCHARTPAGDRFFSAGASGTLAGGHP